MTERHMTATPAELPDFARNGIDLADVRRGADVVSCSDEFFGPCVRMLAPDPAVFYPDRFDDHGKWMDGWETRRRRNGGHDWAIVKLAGAASLHAVCFDTSFFTGNFAPAVSLEGCWSPDATPDANSDWQPLVEALSLSADDQRFVAIADQRTWTHVRVSLFPDGGLARLRLYGKPQCDWQQRDGNTLYNLLAEMDGARFIACSDSHYGTPANLLRAEPAINMGDGWETRRRREPGHDWCILQLAHPGVLSRIDVQTTHFKGNFPDRLSIQAALVGAGTTASIVNQSLFWQTLLPEQPLRADADHRFDLPLDTIGPISHLRVNMHPDGGLARMQAWGLVNRTTS